MKDRVLSQLNREKPLTPPKKIQFTRTQDSEDEDPYDTSFWLICSKYLLADDRQWDNLYSNDRDK